MKLAVVASHPIQYHAPLFRLLAEGVDLRVFFAHIPDAARQGEGFGTPFEWDIPLTTGYASEVFAQTLERPRDFAGILRAASNISSRFASWRPDAILHTGWHHPGMVAGMISAIRSGLPLLFRGEANCLGKRAGWKYGIHARLLAKFDRILYIGEANRRYYDRCRVEPGRLKFCPFFADNARLQSGCAERGRDAVRTGLGIPAEAVCFLFCGKLEPKKRPLDFARGVAAVPSGIGLVAGDGEHMPRLREMGERLRFAGFLNQSRVCEAYAAADALVLPSDAGEVWGLVVNEAMACGLPCIVSDLVGCRPDLVIEGVTGFSYPCGDVEALASRMRVLAGDPALRAKMGAAARGRVSGIYTVERAAAAVLEAAREAVASFEADGRSASRGRVS